LLTKKRIIIVISLRIAIFLIIDLRKRILLRNIKKIKTTKLKKSSIIISKTTIIIILLFFFNTINYTISLQTIIRYLVFLLY